MNAAKIISKRSKTVRQTSGESDPKPARGDQKRDPRPSGDYKGREGMGRREQTIKETKHAREGTGKDRKGQGSTGRHREGRKDRGLPRLAGRPGDRGKTEKRENAENEKKRTEGLNSTQIEGNGG